MTYLAKPMTVYNFLMLSFVSVMTGLPIAIIFIAVIGLIAITILVAKKDRKVLQQEQKFITSNNPILMSMRHDIAEIKDMLKTATLEKSTQG